MKNAKPASTFMRPLSDEFTRSFELFSFLIDACNDDRDIRIYNIAIITNCVAHIESAVNEKLQILQNIKALTEAEFHKIDEMSDVSHIKKTEKIHEKWDRIKELENSDIKWSKGNVIFSNFAALLSLRNEVLHYKCDYLAALELPNKKIKSIMKQVCEEQPWGNKPYRKQLNQSWCSYLLSHKKLAKWCIKTTEDLNKLL